ncbi:hypothetical protein [Enterococcus sp. AZ129]|uniref:hypothetical protein n=1 Tax=unclassified Enterococcus TaxID=2608891 RepID=UPI003F285846
MKYKIAVNETLSATRYIEVEYDEDVAELLHYVEISPYEENVARTLEELGAIILKEDQPIVGEISDWETESLDYSVMLEEEMKFYEIKSPYYALIAAENQKQCLERYRGIGCEVEDEKEFFANMKTIDKSEAFHLLSECHNDEFGEFSMEEFLNEIENFSKEGEVLLIDYALMCGE